MKIPSASNETAPGRWEDNMFDGLDGPILGIHISLSL